MVQIGPIKYDKAEEAILTKSLLLGTFLGLLLSIPLNYMLGFPTMPKQIPTSFPEQVASLFLTFISFLGFGWIITILLSLYFFRTKQRTQFKDIYRILFASFIFFPILLLYVALVFSAILIPFNTFFAWLGYMTLYWIGALLFFPFLVLFIAIVGPDSRPGKALRRLICDLKRSSSRNGE
jgi:hypothetical protein